MYKIFTFLLFCDYDPRVCPIQPYTFYTGLLEKDLPGSPLSRGGVMCGSAPHLYPVLISPQVQR